MKENELKVNDKITITFDGFGIWIKDTTLSMLRNRPSIDIIYLSTDEVMKVNNFVNKCKEKVNEHNNKNSR